MSVVIPENFCQNGIIFFASIQQIAFMQLKESVFPSNLLRHTASFNMNENRSNKCSTVQKNVDIICADV
jgi:hypothetical protein